MRKLLVANRGEIAVRILDSARRLGLPTVAVHSEADRDALHVSLADEAIEIGPPKPAESYLRIQAILDAARKSGADAIHPGYGFLAENAGFAKSVEDAGLTFVGPASQQIASMGDKERARKLAVQAGVPVLPGSQRFASGALEGLAEAAETVGFPLLVKATAGGGGVGMRLVEGPDSLREVAEATQRLAERAFGDGTIFLERYIRNARHVEVQVFGHGDGRATHIFERECSIQRRFQKLVEESPAPGLPEETRRRMHEAAASLARAINYRSAGTVEFVVDADTDAFYFLEMNTRIQVEHPVTEMITGLDLVGLQIRLAHGEDIAADLDPERLAATGHAIECRICAENPSKMFLPSPGRLATLAFPEAEGLRVDSGVREGDLVTPFYDPMIAKMIVHGKDREQAIERMRKALEATRIEGIASNAAFLARLVDHQAFRGGRISTSFIQAHHAELIG